MTVEEIARLTPRCLSLPRFQASVLVACALITGSGTAIAQSALDVRAIITARGATTSGPPSWAEGDYGRFDFGAGGSGSRKTAGAAIAQLGLDWTVASWIRIHADGLLRSATPAHDGENGGIVQAYAELRGERGSNVLQLRAGQFFLPTSRENVDDLWTSPYLISFSAVNSWAAQEVRPVGADLQWRHTFGDGLSLTLGGTAFRRNDSMGAMLGWRGWTLGNRLTVYDEVLPLPPLFSLTDPALFTTQRGDGSKPFGVDLDDRTGYSGRVRVRVPERGLLQYTRVDNRGDRNLNRGEYAWATRYDQVSAELGSPDRAILVAEYIGGSTGMGFPPVLVDADFHAAYVLGSVKLARSRFSVRHDVFGTNDRDLSIAETNDESGRAWTGGWLFDINAGMRAGLELIDVRGRNTAKEQSGFGSSLNGRSLTAELRYRF